MNSYRLACIETGEMAIDLAKRQVKVKGKDIHLTPTEYKLLALLVKHAGKVVTHQQLLKEIWVSIRRRTAITFESMHNMCAKNWMTIRCGHVISLQKPE